MTCIWLAGSCGDATGYVCTTWELSPTGSASIPAPRSSQQPKTSICASKPTSGGFSWIILLQGSSVGYRSRPRHRSLCTQRQLSVPAHPFPHPTWGCPPACAPRKTFRHHIRLLRQSGISRIAYRLASQSAGWDRERDQRQFRDRAQLPVDPIRRLLPYRLRLCSRELRCARKAVAVNPLPLIIPFIHQDCISRTRSGSATAGDCRMHDGPLPK
jgi:hypothetical protein